MAKIHLLRHGPKNNNPEAHQTGVEALLDPQGINKIISQASELLSDRSYAVRNGFDYSINTFNRIRVETTPVNRAISTGNIVYKVLSLDPRFEVPEPIVNELIGSYGINPLTNDAINLSPKSMSGVWGEAKKQETYQGQQGEHCPLYAWCEQGFDNPQAGQRDDLGISLREIACRLGTYVFNTLETADEHDLIIAYGHSGDIEPFSYLILEMLEGRDGTDKEAMTRRFRETGGALEPLEGLNISYIPKISGTYSELLRDVLKQQAEWFKEYGRSKEVLAEKLRQGN